MQVGDRAPSFKLPDHRGEVFASEEVAADRLLVYWYPKADTPGCAAQAQGLRDQMDAFEAAGCAVVGASFDPVEDLAAFHDKFDLNFPLLSDVDRRVGASFGVAGDDGTAAYAQRVGFLIGADGAVEVRYDVDDPEFFADSVLNDLEEREG